MKDLVFFKLGGTWDMIIKNNTLYGMGTLDDLMLSELEEELGYFGDAKDYTALEKKLTQKIEKIISIEGKTSVDIPSHMNFVPNVSEIGKGKFYSLFSGDSSHMRDSLIAPFAAYLLQFANKNPQVAITGGHGTDTADIAVLPILDAYSFDTQLPAFVFSGANRSHREENSDAPQNFADMFTIAQANLLPGAYWVFANYVFKASDLVKISPLESRILDNFSTFYSPHLRAEKVEDMLKNISERKLRKYASAPSNHIINKVTSDSLFEAMNKVHIVDIGEQNALDEDMKAIMNPEFKAVVVAGHAFGNVSDPIKYACIKAAEKGKLIILASRCLIADVNQRYGASLLTVNAHELRKSGKKIISANKLNKNIARALAIRAVHSDLNEYETGELFNKYAASRQLSEQDIVVG